MPSLVDMSGVNAGVAFLKAELAKVGPDNIGQAVDKANADLKELGIVMHQAEAVEVRLLALLNSVDTAVVTRIQANMDAFAANAAAMSENAKNLMARFQVTA